MFKLTILATLAALILGTAAGWGNPLKGSTASDPVEMIVTNAI